MKKIFISFIVIGGLSYSIFAGDAVSFSKLSAGGGAGTQNNTATGQQPTILYGGVEHNEYKGEFEEITEENLNVKILELIMTGEVSGNIEPTTVEMPGKTTDTDYLGDFVPTTPTPQTAIQQAIIDYVSGNSSAKYPGDFVPTTTTTLSDFEWIANLGTLLNNVLSKSNNLDDIMKNFSKVMATIGNAAEIAEKIGESIDKVIDFFNKDKIADLQNKIENLERELKEKQSAKERKIKKGSKKLANTNKKISAIRNKKNIAKNELKKLNNIVTKKLGPLKNIKKAGYVEYAFLAKNAMTAEFDMYMGIITGDFERYKKGRVAGAMLVVDFFPSALDGGIFLGEVIQGGVAQAIPGGGDWSYHMDEYENFPFKDMWEATRAEVEQFFGEMAEREFDMMQKIKNRTQSSGTVQIPRSGEIRAPRESEIR